MPRTIDPSHFMEASAEQPAVLQVNTKDALAMYGVRMQMPDEPMLRRTFHTLVAMFQATHNCDFYITKYHAKPMAQLQSLFANIAMGLRRLETEEEAVEASAVQPANRSEERARRTTLKIANAANRSSWCSCCEMATFIKVTVFVKSAAEPNPSRPGPRPSASEAGPAQDPWPPSQTRAGPAKDPWSYSRQFNRQYNRQ